MNINIMIHFPKWSLFDHELAGAQLRMAECAPFRCKLNKMHDKLFTHPKPAMSGYNLNTTTRHGTHDSWLQHETRRTSERQSSIGRFPLLCLS